MVMYVNVLCELHQPRLTGNPKDIFLLCIATGVSTTASIAQQIHDITIYEEVVREQFRQRKADPNNPEMAIANGSYGLDLVLYYIRKVYNKLSPPSHPHTFCRVLSLQCPSNACHVLVNMIA
jgi:hypothetical protein